MGNDRNGLVLQGTEGVHHWGRTALLSERVGQARRMSVNGGEHAWTAEGPDFALSAVGN